ncbi:MFS transporter [Dactylosporangium aurantiacum]|uniref:MFS transporter n=1 Tax=Dactylosporangium aurantiacum TaxID=35754 RepID=A0A9Q9IQ90_9ACTN|nr:MFS transporter [Dactylosporangium aurantiacum]MDG6105639.1 MFS transporter [Dactylosporangium aurantiacum]UWZ57028.1 MFS transporter [Dactylosporangium aurantiacum]
MERRADAALAALAVATFIFVTVEVLPIGLLTLIADDLGRSRAEVGMLLTGYAAVVVLLSVPMAAVTRRVPRRLLLGATLGLSAAATAVSAVAQGYAMLLGARLVVASTQALFWSIVGSTATAMFPPSQRGRTVARMSIGAALAPVLGVPAGTWLGQQLGWRAAFGVMAVIGAATCVAVVVLLPASLPSGAASARAVAPDRRRYLLLLLVTTLGVAGAMTAQTYVTPFLLDVTHFAAASLGPLLLVSGAGGIAGTLVVGRFLDRHPWPALAVPMALLCAAAVVLYAGGTVRVPAIVALATSGAAYAAFAAAVQNRVLQVAPGSTDMASAGSSSSFNIGIAAGSFVGGVIIEDVSVRAVALAAAVLIAAALAALLLDPFLPRREPSRTPGRRHEPLTAAACPEKSGNPNG